MMTAFVAAVSFAATMQPSRAATSPERGTAGAAAQSAGDPLDLASWSAGDVHTHSAGDASLRDNLFCRNTDPPLIPRSGSPTTSQKKACAAYLVRLVTNAARGRLDWVVLSEHGPWLGINSPNGGPSVLHYDAAEGRAEWNIIADEADTQARTSGLRMLIGEEMGTVATTGHFSAYSIPDYVRNGPLNPIERLYVRDVHRVGGWGGVNHPVSASSWGCWACFKTYPDTLRTLEIVNSTDLPRTALLKRWDDLLRIGRQVGAVGGGDTHTVARYGLDPRVTQQHAGDIDDLGSDGRARTYAFLPTRPTLDGFDTRNADDPVRKALFRGESLASNGPSAGVSLDGAAPSVTAIPAGTSHTLDVAWDTSKAAPTEVRVVVGQRQGTQFAVLPACTKKSAGRNSACRVSRTFSVEPGDALDGRTTIPLSATDFRPMRAIEGASPRTPSTYVRVEIEFPAVGGSRRAVYASPFYVAGSALP